MSLFSDSDTSSSQSSETQQTSQNVEGQNAFGLSDVEGDISLDVELTDAGAVQAAFNFAEGTAGSAFASIDAISENAFDFAGDVTRQASNVEARAVDTLSGAITKAGDVTRNDITDLLRRIAIPGVIAIGVVFGLRALRRT